MNRRRPAPRRDPYEADYWLHVAAGELRLQCCRQCSRYRYPPASICDGCGNPDADWRALSGRGRIVAWSIFHRTYFPDLPAPYTVISVETEEGPLLVGNLLDADGAPSIGAPVVAVFEDALFDDGTSGRICQWRYTEIDDPMFKGEDA